MPQSERTDFAGLEIRGHATTEFDALARMNKALIEDEESRNPMSVAELRDRFGRFVGEEGWTVEVFTWENQVVGFITYRYEPDPIASAGQCVHLRQFYIARTHRRQGIGAAAIALFKRSRLRRGDRVVLEVLETNPGGKRFWQHAGFVPYAAVMECTA